MTKYILSLLAILIFSVITISAQTIAIDSVHVQDNNNMGDNVYLGNGDYIRANITVIDDYSWGNISYAYLSWGSSYVYCNHVSHTVTDRLFACIMTVTPAMNTTQDVYVHAVTKGGNVDLLLGTYDFMGTPFPKWQKVCEVRTYEKRVRVCTPEIYYREKYRNICSYTMDERGRNVRICHREAYLKPYTRNVCEYIIEPYEKEVCRNVRV
jgi:hypothetical protein